MLSQIYRVTVSMFILNSTGNTSILMTNYGCWRTPTSWARLAASLLPQDAVIRGSSRQS